MESEDEPVWRKLKRREDLRKAETAMGGRKRYVSPLELYRKQLDAEEDGQKAPRNMESEKVKGSESSTPAEDTDSEYDFEHTIVMAPPSPDEYEQTARLSQKSLHLFSDAYTRDYTPEGGNSLKDESNSSTRDTWLKCIFPFKPCQRVTRPASKTSGRVDASTVGKEALFRKTLYKKNKSKAVGRVKHEDLVERSAISTSLRSKTKTGRKSLEGSDDSRTQRKSTSVGRLSAERQRRKGAESGREYRDLEGDVVQNEVDSSDGGLDYTLLVEIYRRAGRFPFGRCQSEIRSSDEKPRNHAACGPFTRAMVKTRYRPDGVQRAISSTSPSPCSLGARRFYALQRQDSSESGGGVVVASTLGGRCTHHIKKSGSPVDHGGHVNRPAKGRVARLMAMDLEKSGTNVSSRPSRGTEETQGDHGYTAFVPFQGFAAFANQGGSARADMASFTRSFESQCSSAGSSRNSSHSKANGKYSQKK